MRATQQKLCQRERHRLEQLSAGFLLEYRQKEVTNLFKPSEGVDYSLGILDCFYLSRAQTLMFKVKLCGSGILTELMNGFIC